MASAALRIVCDIESGKIFRHPLSGEEFTLADWTQGSQIPIEFFPVKRKQSGVAPFFDAVDVNGVSCRCYLALIDGTTYASQTTWTGQPNAVAANGGLSNYFEAVLNLNTTELNAKIGSSLVVSDVYLVFQLDDGSGWRTVYQAIQRIKRAAIVPGAAVAAPTPSEDYYTREQVANLFLQLAENPAGFGPILVSQDGTQKGRLVLGNHGELQIEPLT